jgi:uncharacterized protein
MGALKDKLQHDLTEAMRAKDELVRASLRMALTALGNEEVAGKTARALSDDEELAVVTREAKKRREAAQAFRSGGAAARAERELAEERVLAAYLPEQMGDDELQALVAEAVAQTGATGPRSMGDVMKVVRPQVAGRVEGGRLAAAVKAALPG